MQADVAQMLHSTSQTVASSRARGRTAVSPDPARIGALLHRVAECLFALYNRWHREHNDLGNRQLKIGNINVRGCNLLRVGLHQVCRRDVGQILYNVLLQHRANTHALPRPLFIKVPCPLVNCIKSLVNRNKQSSCLLPNLCSNPTPKDLAMVLAKTPPRPQK